MSSKLALASLLGLVIVALAPPARATAHDTPPLVLPEADAAPVLRGAVRYLVDPGGALSLAQVRARADAWQRLGDGTNFGFTDAAYWLHFRVHNPRPEAAQSAVVFRYALLDHVDAYLQQPDGAFRHLASGDGRPFSARPIHDTSIAIPVHTEDGETQDVYVRIATTSSMQIGFDVMPMRTLVSESSRLELMHGLYYGLMLVMVAYNLFLFFSVRSTSYLLYVVFVLVFAAMQMTLDGTATRYLLGSWPGLTNKATPLLVALAQLPAVLFTMQFLDTRNNLPRAHRALRVYVVVIGGVILTALLTPNAIAIRVAAGSAVLMTGMAEVLGIVVWVRGYRPARYYVLAWTALNLGTILAVLNGFGVLPMPFNVQRLGSAIEVTLLSFALGDRIKLLEEEREQARAEALALERDLALTAAVQQLFLPAHDRVETDELRLVGHYQPATRCGGDWWWYEQRDDGRLLVLLGDVTGHGAAAAMMTAAVSATYRSLPATSREHAPEQTLEVLSRAFRDICAGSHNMTLAAVELDPREGRLRMWSSGGPAILVLGAGGKVAPLTARGNPIGAAETRVGYVESDLSPGDRVFLFSDGLPELVRANGRQLGYRATGKLLAATHGKDLDAARAHLERAVADERAGGPLQDDITFVLVDILDRQDEQRAA